MCNAPLFRIIAVTVVASRLDGIVDRAVERDTSFNSDVSGSGENGALLGADDRFPTLNETLPTPTCTGTVGCGRTAVDQYKGRNTSHGN